MAMRTVPPVAVPPDGAELSPPPLAPALGLSCCTAVHAAPTSARMPSRLMTDEWRRRTVRIPPSLRGVAARPGAGSGRFEGRRMAHSTESDDPFLHNHGIRHGQARARRVPHTPR